MVSKLNASLKHDKDTGNQTNGDIFDISPITTKINILFHTQNGISSESDDSTSHNSTNRKLLQTVSNLSTNQSCLLLH